MPIEPNIIDAIPTMGYAITALKRSGGDQKSPYWKNYSDAIAHFTQTHGEEAAKQLQDIAYQTAITKGDLNDELTKFSKRSIDTKTPFLPVIQNMLAMAYDGQKPLERVTYGFDVPKSGPSTVEKIVKVFKR